MGGVGEEGGFVEEETAGFDVVEGEEAETVGDVVLD